MRSVNRILGTGLCVACLLLASPLSGQEAGDVAAARPKEPWDGPAFSANPEVLVQALAGQPAPKDADCEVLLEEATYRFDERERRVSVYRTVVRCLTRDGAESWSTVSAWWAPWYQNGRFAGLPLVGLDHWPCKTQ
jgi:hypothetical protein